MTEHTHPFIVRGQAEDTQAQAKGAIALLQHYHELRAMHGDPGDPDLVAHWGAHYVLEGLAQAVDHLTELATTQQDRGAYVGLQPVEEVSQ